MGLSQDINQLDNKFPDKYIDIIRNFRKKW